MAQIKNVDITPGGVQTTVINVSQDDVGREIVFNVKDGSGPFDLTDYTVKLAGLKPSGLGFSVDGDIDTSKVTITTTKQMTDEYGQIACELQILDGDDIKIGTANMILAVERNPHPDHTTDGSVDDLIPEITILVERIEAAVAKAEVLFEAEAWARGTRDGVPVTEDDDTYHNNSKYYSELAETSKENAASYASSAHSDKNAAKDYKDAAGTSATDASNAKVAAQAAQAAAEQAARDAQSVFQVDGGLSASVDPSTKKVTLYFTETE